MAPSIEYIQKYWQSPLRRGQGTQSATCQRNFKKSRHSTRKSGTGVGNISAKAECMHAFSDTSASDAMYVAYRHNLDEYLGAFSDVPNQTGVIFSVNGFSFGLDIFDSTKALTGSLNKLIESYALDAVDQQIEGKSEKTKFDAQKFLNEIKKANLETYPGVGVGENHRFDNGELSGGALVANERLIHLCAFYIPEEDERWRRHSRIIRASTRIRNRRN